MTMHLGLFTTMRAAYRHWQAQETRLVQARQRLARQYLASHGLAVQVKIEPHQGLLRAARTTLDSPLAPALARVQGQLQRTFALRGRGFCRRLPPPLEAELTHYLAEIGKICRAHDKLEARLRFSQGLIETFGATPEFCRAHFFRLALISPESAWLLCQLRQDRLALQDYLAQNCPQPAE